MPQINIDQVNGKVIVTVDQDLTPLVLESFDVLQYRKFPDDSIRFCNKERVADLPVEASVLSEISINGVTPTTFDELDAALAELFPVMASTGGGGGLGYLVYTALISQLGTDNPTVVILKNTLGDIVWTRSAEGFYIGTLAGAFPEDKVWFSQNCRWVNGQISFGIDSSPDSIYIETLVSGVDTDSKIIKTPIEIRVYP